MGIELVDDPGQNECQHKSNGAGDHGYIQGVAHRDQEHRALQEHPLEILNPDKGRRRYHIVVEKAQHQGGEDRQDGKQEKQDHKRRQHDVERHPGSQGMLDFMRLGTRLGRQSGLHWTSHLSVVTGRAQPSRWYSWRLRVISLSTSLLHLMSISRGFLYM